MHSLPGGHNCGRLVGLVGGYAIDGGPAPRSFPRGFCARAGADADSDRGHIGWHGGHPAGRNDNLTAGTPLLTHHAAPGSTGKKGLFCRHIA